MHLGPGPAYLARREMGIFNEADADVSLIGDPVGVRPVFTQAQDLSSLLTLRPKQRKVNCGGSLVSGRALLSALTSRVDNHKTLAASTLRDGEERPVISKLIKARIAWMAVGRELAQIKTPEKKIEACARTDEGNIAADPLEGPGWFYTISDEESMVAALPVSPSSSGSRPELHGSQVVVQIAQAGETIGRTKEGRPSWAS
ncbi:hypothetical protein BX600DRAFT_430732 [Xylariales sp. PMI_506]|nr:hypothetical protein BX600DRAFT_430732 [Xylariales sp. PMI_506]